MVGGTRIESVTLAVSGPGVVLDLTMGTLYCGHSSFRVLYVPRSNGIRNRPLWRMGILWFSQIN
jgi:hypothetical protein